MLAAEQLSVTVRRASLLRDIGMTFAPGRITAIIGPNGAGKSTLLDCLAGLRMPERGRVLLDGAPLAGLGRIDLARRIGYLPQEAPVHWNISVRALAALGRFPHRRGLAGETEEDREAVSRALAEADMTAFADRLTGTLSGGERARAMLARVLAARPAWILADEPMAALDIAHRYALMAQLHAVARRGVGVVLVIHDLALAARMADDALLLDGGQFIAAGPVGEVLTPARLGPVFGVDFAYAQASDGSPTLVSAPRLP